MSGKLHRRAMNLHQFRFVQEAVRRNLNLTEVAKSLHTSQPGVSKAIIELEEELGIEIFSRHGKRLKRVTEPGQHVLRSIEVILREVGNLKRIGEQFSAEDSGTLSIATTHTQARYVLPVPVAKLREAYPNVNISLHQGAPAQVAQMVFDAMHADQFYIYSHPKALGNAQTRFDAIVHGHNPPDPFAERPDIGVQLRQALRG